MKQTLSLSLFFSLLFTGMANSQDSADVASEKNSIEFSSNCKILTGTGLPHEKGITRRDPSDVIKAGNIYYLWYTKITLDDPGYPSGYHGTIWYATSNDGKNWKEQGQALDRGKGEVWDGYAVFTPNILVADGQYFLFYTGVAPDFSNYPHNGYNEGPATPTAIGVAIAASPEGPWERIMDNPVLKPGNPGNWDDWRVDDACLLKRDDQYWLYYKGRQDFRKKGGTPMGLARANSPTGPYVRCDKNPLIGPGHEVLVWPHAEGVAALVGSKNVYYSPDGIHFEKQVTLDRGVGAPGAFRPDAFTDTECGHGITWGVAMFNEEKKYFGFPEASLIVFECMLNFDGCK